VLTVKRIAIIGAGISGLAAGCYGQMNSFDTEIYEMHNLPGGVCTSWKRQGYTIDGCIHWLIGSSPCHTFYSLYEELGIIQKRNFWNAEEFMRIEDGDKVLVVYTDADKLEQHMKELSPQDEKVIKEFTSLLRLFKKFNPPLELVAGGGVSFKSMKAIMNTLPFLRSMSKYGKVSIADFASKFKDPFFKEAFLKIMEIPQMSIMSLVLTLAMMASKNAGYPIGGSLELAKAVEKRYLALGGKIHYNSKVTKIIVENNVAVGVQLSDGSEYKSDLVISAADGRSTIYDMLDGKYVDKTIEKYYTEMPVFDPLVYVSIGIDSDFSREPTHLIFKTKSPVHIGEKTFHSIGCTNYSFDSTLAPVGKTVLISMFPTSYEYWKKIATQRQIYENEKQRISQEVIAALEMRFPRISNKVEVIDVATPLTFERYTANYHGAYEGWLPTTKNYGKTLKNTLAGLNNFYLIGQWIVPGGGIPIGVTTGRQVINTLCKKENKPFFTNKP
jgi:phytoene dehydrogenase-like protein